MILSHKFKITAASLIITNLFLLVCAIIFEWRIYDQVMVFWSENLVIGFYTLIKIPFCRPVSSDMIDHLPVSPKYAVYVLIPFFLLGFLIFCALHLALIHGLFADDVEAYARAHEQDLFPQIDWIPVLIAVCALMVNHGISLGINFFGRKEYMRYTMTDMFTVPYKRLVFVHMAVMISGLTLNSFGHESVFAVILFFAVKIWVDYRRHKAEHDPETTSFFKWI